MKPKNNDGDYGKVTYDALVFKFVQKKKIKMSLMLVIYQAKSRSGLLDRCSTIMSPSEKLHMLCCSIQICEEKKLKCLGNLSS